MREHQEKDGVKTTTFITTFINFVRTKHKTFKLPRRFSHLHRMFRDNLSHRYLRKQHGEKTTIKATHEHRHQKQKKITFESVDNE